MLTVYEASDIERMIQACRRELNRSGISKELRLKSIPKPSLRRREKERLAASRRKKQERRRVIAEARREGSSDIRKMERDKRIFARQHPLIVERTTPPE